MAKQQKKTGILRLIELAGQKGDRLVLACLLSVLSSAARMVAFFTIYGVCRQLSVWRRETAHRDCQSVS